MKTLLATLASVAFIVGCASADPVGKATPNGGFEYYSNKHIGEGTVENGCILPWEKAGYPTMGFNPKRVDMGDITTFDDCKVPERTVVEQVVTPVQEPVPAPEPVVAPAPTHVQAHVPMPAPEQRKPIKE